jgi:hypothetical protein
MLEFFDFKGYTGRRYVWEEDRKWNQAGFLATVLLDNKRFSAVNNTIKDFSRMCAQLSHG